MQKNKKNEIMFIIRDSLDGGYEIEAIDYPIFTQCEIDENIREVLKDAVLCHFDEMNRPSIIRMQFIREEIIAI